MKADAARAFIARHRTNWLLRATARAANRYLRAYRNELNWSIAHNGERAVLAAAVAAFDGCILDVGANFGQWARMAIETAPDRDLHCFEISPDTFGKLSRRLTAGPRLHLMPCGLSAGAGTLTLYHYPDSPDRSSLIDQPDGFAKRTCEVRVITGDSYLEKRGIEKICFLKIDVEGHEMDVLRGFAGTLKERRIGAIQFEHGPAHVVSRHFLKDFVAFFGEFGYRVHEIYPDGSSPLAYSYETGESFAGRNYLALR